MNAKRGVKMKKILCMALALTLVLACFAGCGAVKKNLIVGTWSYQQTTILNVVTERTYTFREDGTGSAPVLDGITNVDMTYTLAGDQLTINRGELIDSITGAEVYTVKFGVNTLTLTGTDGSVIELTKVS